MKGRKPLPPTLRLIKSGKSLAVTRGNPRRGAADLPRPPDFLMPAALDEWTRLLPQLYAAGLLTKLDMGPFAAYCQSFARWRQAEEILAKGELIVTTHHGNQVQHVALGIARRAAMDMLRYGTEFGLTPSARARVEASPPLPADDIASKFFD